MTFVHTGNTGSEAYYRLADRIRDKISFSVIEPFNLWYIEQATYGIHDIAKRYIDVLKRHQPQGSYILGGWCYGGKVLRYHKEDDKLRSIGSSFLLLKAAKGREIHYSLEDKPFVDGKNHFNIFVGNYKTIND